MTGSPALIDAVVELAERARDCARDGAQESHVTLVVGINGPQGAGKSTMAAAVVARARAQGKTAVALSVDDFYLTRAEQLELAARHPGNRYLEHRGYPGTHDVALGTATLRALRAARAGDKVALPYYDKGAHRGRGDRPPRPAWPVIAGPVDLVLFEGWMLGFPLVDPGPADPALRVAARLVAGYRPWTEALDAFAHLEADDPSTIVGWRVEAERARRQAGAGALSDEQARDYIERFLPAYALWVPALRERPPAGGRRTSLRSPLALREALPSLWARLGPDRNPIEIVSR